jgi:hypothetical protein
MRESIEEALNVMAGSRSIQVLVLFGPVAFAIITIAGQHLAASVDTGGTYGPLLEVMRDKVLKRSIWGGIGAWLGCWLSALRLVARERQRLRKL